MAAGNIVARFYIESVLKFFGRVNALAYCMLMGAFAYALVGFTTNFALLFVWVLIIGCCLGITQPISIIIAYNLAPKNQTASGFPSSRLSPNCTEEKRSRRREEGRRCSRSFFPAEERSCRVQDTG